MSAEEHAYDYAIQPWRSDFLQFTDHKNEGLHRKKILHILNKLRSPLKVKIAKKCPFFPYLALTNQFAGRNTPNTARPAGT